MIFRTAVLTAGLALGATTQAFSAQQANPSATPAAAPQATESVSPVPSPSPALTPAVSPSPTATPANPYKYVVEPPAPSPSASPDAPQILRIEVNESTLHAGGQAALRVTTSSNVKRVIAMTEGQNIEIGKAQDGIFAGLTTLPSFIPPWYFKTYQVTLVALTADGKKTAFTIPITLAR